MNKNSRLYNILSNSFWGIIAAIITVILNFAVRIFIVKELGAEINGLHNLFQNTINIMAIMESSMCSAMIINLYAPVRIKDEITIQKLLSFYKKMYFGIAVAFILVGLIVDLFFIDKIITTTVSIKTVRIYFILFIGSFFANYLTYYKRCLLYASQNNRISIIANTISQIIFRGLAIISAIITHDYLYFLLCLILEKISGNILCNSYIDRHFPFLREKCKVKLEKKFKTKLFQNIRPLIVNQVALAMQNSSTSVLISMLLGNIAIVGYYGNYQLVISTVQLLFSQVGSAFTTTFGSLATENNKKDMYKAYQKSTFVINSLAFISCAGFVGCIQDFIGLIFGTSFVLSTAVVFIFAFSLLVYLLNIPIISVQNAMGLHGSDAGIMILQALIAVVLGYYGGSYFGMEGILLGVIIPTVCFTLFLKGIRISRIAFGISKKRYLYNISFELLKGTILLASLWFISSNIELENHIINIIIKGSTSLIIAIVVIIITSFTNILELKSIINTMIRRR